MPRAVDPPGRYPTADFDPASRNLLFNPLTMPKFDWLGWLKQMLHQGITWACDVIKYLTCQRVDLHPLHEMLDEFWEDFVAGIGTGRNVAKMLARAGAIFGEGFELNFTRLIEIWQTFYNTWRELDWLGAPLGAITAGWQALVTFVCDLGRWLAEVINNLLSIRLPGFFALDDLRAVWAGFTGAWSGIEWSLWQAPRAIRAALSAVTNLAGGIVDWALAVVRNLAGIDMRALLSGFALADLRAALGTFSETIAGINWLGPGALMAAIGGVVRLLASVGGWLLTVVRNFLGWDADAIRQMFSSLTSFVDTLVKYFLGDNALMAWRAALDLLAGIIGASPLDALTALYDKLRELLSTNIGDLIAQLTSINIGDLLQQVLGGLIPIGNLTGQQQNLLEGVGAFPAQANIAENPYWIWDSAVTLVPDGTGSARVDADGTVKALRSQRFAVAADMPMHAEVKVRWQNLSSTGAQAPLQLQLLPFNGDAVLPPVVIDNALLPTPANNETTLNGDWTVPSAGVDGVRMRLYVDESALAGRTWWDNAILKRTGGILQSWVSGLQATLDGIGAWIQGIADTIWRGLTGLVGANISLTDLYDAAHDIANRVNGIIDDLWSAFTGLLDFDPGKTLEDLREAAAGIANGVRGLIDELWAAFTQVFDEPGKNLTNLADAARDAIAGPGGVIQTISNLITGILGIGSRPITHEDSAEAIASLASITQVNSEELNRFLASITTGVAVSDAFGRSANNLGPQWNETYTAGNGSMRTNGTAYWATVWPYGDRDGTFIWLGPTGQSSLTDYQEVGIVCGGGIQVGANANLFGHNDVVCRWALNNYVRWRVSGDKSWQLSYFVAGNHHEIARGTLPYAVGPGTFVRIRAGDKETNQPRRFQGLLGPEVIWTWTDTNLVTAIGAGNRGWGFGARAEGISLVSQNVCAPVSQWLAKDQ